MPHCQSTSSGKHMLATNFYGPLESAHLLLRCWSPASACTPLRKRNCMYFKCNQVNQARIKISVPQMFVPGCRAYGCDAPVGLVYGINPFMIIFMVPLIGALTTNFAHFDMIHYGSYLSAFSPFWIVAFPSHGAHFLCFSPRSVSSGPVLACASTLPFACISKSCNRGLCRMERCPVCDHAVAGGEHLEPQVVRLLHVTGATWTRGHLHSARIRPALCCQAANRCTPMHAGSSPICRHRCLAADFLLMSLGCRITGYQNRSMGSELNSCNVCLCRHAERRASPGILPRCACMRQRDRRGDRRAGHV